jgi:hypothetical protein
MRAIPYAGVQAFRTLAARTALVRALLAVVLVVLVLAAALSVRSPHAAAQPFLPPRAGGVVVLDLSASITSDTYSRIHNTLAQLVSRGGRYGLVVFSNVAYEALPPGSPASALAPLIRYFAVPSKVAPGEQPTFPVNPWTASFTSGTAISAGLDLARRIELQSHVRRPAVVLVSDLADDPNDIQRLSERPGLLRETPRKSVCDHPCRALDRQPHDRRAAEHELPRLARRRHCRRGRAARGQ